MAGNGDVNAQAEAARKAAEAAQKQQYIKNRRNQIYLNYNKMMQEVANLESEAAPDEKAGTDFSENRYGCH